MRGGIRGGVPRRIEEGGMVCGGNRLVERVLKKKKGVGAVGKKQGRTAVQNWMRLIQVKWTDGQLCLD